MTELTCFNAYDVRGEIGVNINEDISCHIGRVVAQHFSAKSIVIGFDARETGPGFASAASRNVRDAGTDVINIGMAGTEEMYWAVPQFSACAEIEVTASHNPINYNGVKIVKSGSCPLVKEDDFQVIKALAASKEWLNVVEVGRGIYRRTEARAAYVDRVLTFVDVKALWPLKIVVNCGNGAAGPTFDVIADRLLRRGAPLEFISVYNEPDATFPNGIPNPLLPENHALKADVVNAEDADFGIAFDGDFAYCDSGMIPWVLVSKFVSCSGCSLGDWVKDLFVSFPSLGEINFQISDAVEAIDAVLSAYGSDALSVDETDGVSLEFEDWGFNLRRSNTEPLVRLNVESKGRADIVAAHVSAIADLLDGTNI